MNFRFGMILLALTILLMLDARMPFAQTTQSPEGIWTVLPNFPASARNAEPWIRPQKYCAVALDAIALRDTLDLAPLELTQRAEDAPAIITLPMPDGKFARFTLMLSPVMAPELAAKFPETQTYAGQGIDDPAATVRLDWTPQGFHAQILSPNGRVMIDPWSRGDVEHYSSYDTRDYSNSDKAFTCLVETEKQLREELEKSGAPSLSGFGATRRVYRLAMAATGEYTQFFGGTVQQAHNAIVTSVNRVNQIYERDASIFMVLVGNNDSLIFTNPATDPFSNDDTGALIDQSQAQITAIIGAANFDIGHTFSTGAGGLAQLQAVCVNSVKASGVTGISQPVGDNFDIDFVAHEIGHQFGGNHTFNGVTDNCSGGNRNGSTAYEPGSGTTIQAYAGICGADDLQPHSDAMFHHHSLAEFISHVTGAGNCSANTPTNNGIPAINAGPDRTIPAGTPFELTPASFSDPNGDTLTFSWEERDLGSAQLVTNADNGASPLFRCFLPMTNPTRTFPRLSDLLNNTTVIGEKLPTTNRILNFRCLVRDNHAPDGAIEWDDVRLTVIAGAPFRVTAPNAGGSFQSGTTVTWDVAGTNAGAVNTPNVNILLSTDGGQTFPTTLAANTLNDGSEAIVFPNTPTATARIKVQGAGNIFFDITNQNFTILSAPPAVFGSTGVNLAVEQTGNGNHSPEPGEVVDLTLQVRNTGTANLTNVNGTLVSNTAGITVNTAASAYPNLAASNGTGSNITPYRITVNPSFSCGNLILLTLQMSSDQGSGNVPISIIAGVSPSAFSAGPIDFTEIDGNFNSAADPGEILDLNLQIRNNATVALGDLINPLSGTLSSLSSGVTVINSTADYQLNAGQTSGSLTPFRIMIDPAFDCADPVLLRLNMSPDSCFDIVDFELPLGVVVTGSPATFAFDSITGSDSAVTLPDATASQNGVVLVPLNVTGLPGVIIDLNFKIGGTTCNQNAGSTLVGLDHTFVSDLDITLISPDGTQVILLGGIGFSGNNICNMLLDDEGNFPNIQTQINSANAPFTGNWSPNEPLSAFDGEDPNGIWMLKIEDLFEEDSGHVRAFSLIITPNGRNCDPVLPDDQRTEIMQHLLGINPLSGQALINADVNNSGDVTVGDLIFETND